jgi:quercetin dioxygenase-like cupin family protein
MNMKLATTVALLGTLATAAHAQDVVRAGSTEAKPGPSAYFTGQVDVRALTSPAAPGQAGTAIVTFQPGARSNWHTHPAGQILYVTEGCGWTQVEGGPVTRVCKGDTVQAKPGVKHWHGATATTAMSHLTISETLGGKNVDWLEPVSAAQYHGPAS